MNIAIVGATGNVGRKLLEVLDKKKFPITEIFLVASPKSVGKKIKQDGIKRKLMGVKIDHNKIDMYCEKTLFDDNNDIVGYVRSATYSPTFNQVIGIAMINKPYWDSKDQFKIEIDEKIFVGTVCDLPFI